MTRALIVGGGIGGLATALVLSRQGIEVDLIERDAEVRALGSGITLIGAAVRALDRLGVLDECLAEGFGSSEMKVCTPTGEELVRIPLPSAEAGAPGLLGMTRPDLHRVLLTRATAKGITVRTGISPKSIDDLADTARVEFDDGSVGEFDLVIGADGLRSTVREMVFGAHEPTFRGQVCIRAVLDRPAEITTEMQFHGRQFTHVGFTPISQSKMYLYCCVPVPATTRPPQTELPRILREHLAPFGGPVGAVRELIIDPAAVHYAPLETIVVPQPWYRGRTVLVGDAAHSTTPQLAAGGAMCLEDALVLGEELAAAATIPDALHAYSKRRFDRCKYVVDTSVQLSAWQIQPETPDVEQQRLSSEAFSILAGPY
ncbi:FAD-dependent monooxygenase [Rhodococcus sp. ACT016]|uniref:FAD-dependent monooxygenase n=1 Tax=Rhodococcus sp. ACT016 TaxID=3134808 RepID=UPI003D29E36F